MKSIKMNNYYSKQYQNDMGVMHNVKSDLKKMFSFQKSFFLVPFKEINFDLGSTTWNLIEELPQLTTRMFTLLIITISEN